MIIALVRSLTVLIVGFGIGFAFGRAAEEREERELRELREEKSVRHSREHPKS
jgi:hypothetical protein